MSAPETAPRLWAQGRALDARVHRFTVDEDPELDRRLLPFDLLGTAAHARTLAHAGLLAPAEAEAIVAQLAALRAQAAAGAIAIPPEQEDAHTVIERLLTERLGATGRRVHLGRSRNDQVILALRLYLRAALIDNARATAALAREFLAFARTHAAEPLPGYSHLRPAMPSTFGLWAGGFAAGLAESLEALRALYLRLDRCPLGAAAGFGAPLPVEREYSARLLGFARVQVSPADVMNSRGRHECALVGELAASALVLEKFLWDAALYAMPEFGFVRLPEAFTTGSSIMPQKRNPDVIELARGRCRELRGYAALVLELAGGLPSGYHRDVQLLKGPLFRALDRSAELLALLVHLVRALQTDAGRAAAACTPELYAAHRAAALAREGVPFRDAYRRVAAELADGTFPAAAAAAGAACLGAPGNLGLAQIGADLSRCERWFARTGARLAQTEDSLWAPRA